MHDQPSSGGPLPPLHETPEHALQRKVLLELVLAPAPFTDDLPAMSRRIREPRPAVERALHTLTRAGLTGRDGDAVWATPAARYYEALFPAWP